ncbi:MAG: NADPH-dependent F420 reductase [Thermaerobacterales bacterium]
MIAIIGGTGDLGFGLALRWAKAGLNLIIGSRDGERAGAAARRVLDEIGAGRVKGRENGRAAAAADIIVLAVPFAAQTATLAGVRSYCHGKVVVDTTVPLKKGDPTSLDLPAEGSAAERAAALLGDEVSVVAGFHTVSARLLQDLAGDPAGDVAICGDHAEAKAMAFELVERLGMRPVDCGPLRSAQTLERLTPLIIGLNKRYRRRHIGIRFSGL